MSHLDDPLIVTATASPGREALRTPSGHWTYAELDAWTQVVEGRLLSAGCRPGSVVALEAVRDPRSIALLWAVWRVGAIAAPLNLRDPTAQRVTTARRAGAHLFIGRDEEVMTQARDAGLRTARLAAITESPEDLATPVADPTMRPRRLPLDARATAVSTSGSSGQSKIAVHTLGNHVYSARGSAENIPVAVGDCWLASLPLYHVGGLAILFRSAMGGASVAVPDGGHSVAESIQTLRPTHASLVATQLGRLLERAPDAIAHVKALLLGGSAIPPGLLDRAVDRGWPVHTSYGSTEMSSQITTTSSGADRDTLTTSGQVLPHRDLRIVDERIQVRGKTLFSGYVATEGAAGRLRDARTGDGWFDTGDVGFLDEQNRLHVTGRADRMFVSGGENVHPEEIEAELARCDGIGRAAVVAIEDETFGERPVAFVQWRPDAEVRDLFVELRQALAGYKVPDAIHRMPDAAVDGRMKVDYDLLREAARKLRNE
ncbi:o-succinylbenzoate--CoA ligase [Longibacter sp.]|jgi:O-succinylbenzoic acid--CoA ligase|uniref:o-succinylbenzoate--CoA ligase n=1 Tax=Longibacter sp. TaxID=2045415 RepID=UPI003EBB9021